ncbi:MAG: metallophosphoesterase [Deltaproteobacteria bacterium]|nr:metallophosphoesterase [Deltaproteobacteria bacterium]
MRLESVWVDTAIWAGYMIFGLILFLFTLCLVRDAILLALLMVDRIRTRFRPQTPPVRPAVAWAGKTARATNVLILAFSIMLCVLGVFQARQVPDVRTVTLSLSKLDPALNGLRLVQLTDLHIGPTIRESWLEKVVERTNELEPDLVAITGDLVDGPVERLAEELRPLADIKAELGTFIVTGNHEYYSDALPWIEALRKMGLVVLMNEHAVVEKNGGVLVVAGVTDLQAGRFDPDQRSDPARAVDGAPEQAAKILLAHQPKTALQAVGLGYDLQVSGHTHGGQFFPGTILVHLFQPFVAGLHQVGDMLLYVSRGTGYWGPPLRIGSPSEITLFVLHAPEAD